MRRLLWLMPILWVTGCGAPAEPEAADNKGASGRAPAGEQEREADNTADSRLAEYRSIALEGCIGGARDAAPPGTPVERHCECAIDREMRGRSYDELEAARRSGDYGPAFQAHMRACIAEISPEMARRPR
jgi:hypothetical protein